jgi:hypothetical protein
MKAQLKPLCAAAFALGIGVFAASCSRDDNIVKDYKLYDLDGSNQAIIGGSGMVKVSDVTAYRVDGNLILFETGVLDSPIGLSRAQSELCRYGFIETTKNTIVAAKDGSSLRALIIRKLATESMGTLSRSCVAKN